MQACVLFSEWWIGWLQQDALNHLFANIHIIYLQGGTWWICPCFSQGNSLDPKTDKKTGEQNINHTSLKEKM